MLYLKLNSSHDDRKCNSWLECLMCSMYCTHLFMASLFIFVHHFEGVLTIVFDQCLQLLVQAFMPATDVQVQREVAACPLLSCLPPLIKYWQQTSSWLHQHMVHCEHNHHCYYCHLTPDWWLLTGYWKSLTDSGGSSRQGGSGSLVEVIHRFQAFLQTLQVGVGIHPSGDHQLAICVYCLHARWDDQVLPDLSGQDTWQEVWCCQRQWGNRKPEWLR